MDEFVLQVAIIFLPGLLWAKIDANYAARRKPSQFTFLVNAFFFGLSTYVIVYLVYSFAGASFTVPFKSVDLSNFSLDWFLDEILVSIPTSFVSAIIWCYAVRFRVLMRLLHFLKASKSFGDEDVWEFAFNDEGQASKAVYIRDRDQKVIYSGVVEVFSGSNEKRELVLSKVTVLDDVSGKELYYAPRMYLEYVDRWIGIEFPYAAVDRGEQVVTE